MQLSFLGATGTVTGSKCLLTLGAKKILVDCGLFQGYKELRLRNWSKLPINPADIDAVILTHAHIDHSGYLPLLVKNGFKGPIYSTLATKELCAILLPDSGYLHEEEAKYANKYGFSKHKPALPLYTKEDAEKVLPQFVPMDFDKTYSLFDSNLKFLRAGHILGAAFVQIICQNKSIVFTGDIGRPNDPMMRAPEKIQLTDYLVIESTYGDREHDLEPPQNLLSQIINKTAKRAGSILIPAFAIGRALSLLYYLYQLKTSGKIPNLPVFLDSPMAVNATKLLQRHRDEHRLTPEDCDKVCASVTYVNTPEQSKKIDNYRMPIIIISASGMATGGRVLHHLKAFAPDERNTILFTGFQAGGTRGDRMLQGEREIKIHGQMIPVHAQIEAITTLSAHADAKEILNWLANFKKPPKKVFIIHGDPEAAAALKTKIEKKFGWRCVLPHYLQTENL
jgi:metallo-beta-lactamase family protein